MAKGYEIVDFNDEADGLLDYVNHQLAGLGKCRVSEKSLGLSWCRPYAKCEGNIQEIALALRQWISTAREVGVQMVADPALPYTRLLYWVHMDYDEASLTVFPEPQYDVCLGTNRSIGVECIIVYVQEPFFKHQRRTEARPRQYRMYASTGERLQRWLDFETRLATKLDEMVASGEVSLMHLDELDSIETPGHSGKSYFLREQKRR